MDRAGQAGRWHPVDMALKMRVSKGGKAAISLDIYKDMPDAQCMACFPTFDS